MSSRSTPSAATSNGRGAKHANDAMLNRYLHADPTITERLAVVAKSKVQKRDAKVKETWEYLDQWDRQWKEQSRETN
ncbi:hypothetical protein B0T17DRAFT_613272 [Bombardia bombarda]|uniref:Uncharacterized protein n=1 Tax=Bombardia bombarda TaxID=252184 RepID=A0AA39XM37_9PEZI|nr:hypothetical protein B0T17DRAFT_613272 [Bombardia bombarda]